MHFDFAGCKNEKVVYKLYDGEDFIGGGFTFAPDVETTVGISRPVKKKTLRLHTTIGKPW